MKKLMTKLTKRLTKRYLPESTEFQEIWDSPAYLRAIQFVEEAERTKSLGIHKREYAQAHLKSWYREKSIPRPKENFINLLIESALWRIDR